MNPVTIAVFAGLGLCLVLLEVYGRRTDKVSTVDSTVRRVLGRRIPEVFLLLVWWWIGWHFFIGS